MKLHMDLDCYFVSAERTRYPFLKNRPVVVAKGSDKKIFAHTKKEGVILAQSGAFNSVLEFTNHYDTNNISNAWKDEFIDSDGVIHGIVIAKSYEAKKYKIKIGTPLRDALVMCPELIVLPSDHLFYQMLSFKLKSYLETKIPLIEQYSIDEFFADLRGWVKKEDTLSFIQSLQAQILEKFGLPISIVASKSKWIAKLATDTIKPYGCKVIEDEEIEAFTNPIAIEDFPGIGRAIYKRLKSYGIDTLKDAKRVPSIFASYGKTGKELYAKIKGEDNEPVKPTCKRKGIGISRNFPAIEERSELRRRVMILSRYLSFTIARLGLRPTTFYMKIRYQYGIKSAKSLTIDRLFNEDFFAKLTQELFSELDIHRNYKIHFLALSATNFIDKSNPKSYDIIDFKKDTKNEKLMQGLTKIRNKYGVDMVLYGREMVG
ncbi:MAG TPA: DNA polymerase IV [Sulfurospirillum sp. UBA12182]|nr:MAG TPA: DNA polymerase IV [Sulfurospirillum sp. UBA12182]